MMLKIFPALAAHLLSLLPWCERLVFSPFALSVLEMVPGLVVWMLSAAFWVEVCCCRGCVVLVWVLLVVEDEVGDECVVVESNVVARFAAVVLCVVV